MLDFCLFYNAQLVFLHPSHLSSLSACRNSLSQITFHIYLHFLIHFTLNFLYSHLYMIILLPTTDWGQSDFK